MSEWILLIVYVLSLSGLGIFIYILFKQFEHAQQEHYAQWMKIRNHEIITPLKLQAYERLTLFLERNNLHQLVVRNHQPGLTVRKLQTLMVKNIQSEFDHNITQQIYVSPILWNAIRQYKEETISLINQTAEKVGPEKDCTLLASKLIEWEMERGKTSNEIILEALKKELSQFY